MPRSIENFRRGWVGKVNAAYEQRLSQGFATADFEGQPEPETLQCRNELDRTNWLGLLVKCTEAERFAAEIEADWPLTLQIDPPLRCTSNRMYVISYQDAKGRMLALLDQVGQAQANWWRIKDLVEAAETLDQLKAIDISGGYP